MISNYPPLFINLTDETDQLFVLFEQCTDQQLLRITNMTHGHRKAQTSMEPKMSLFTHSQVSAVVPVWY